MNRFLALSEIPLITNNNSLFKDGYWVEKIRDFCFESHDLAIGMAMKIVCPRKQSTLIL